MAQAGLSFGNSSLNPLVGAPPPPAATGLDALQQSMANIAAIGGAATQQVPIIAPQVAVDTTPSIAYNPSTKQFFVQGQVFSEDDAQRALESEALLGQPGAPIPQGGGWVPVDPQSYAGYLQRIKEPGLGTLFSKGFGRGIDTMQLLGGRALQLVGAEETGAGIVAQQMEDLRRDSPYQRQFSNIESGGDALDYVVSMLGEQAPNLLLGVATGGLGVLGGRALSGVATKQALRSAVSKKAAGQALTAAENKLIRYATAGALVGSASGSYPLLAGEFYDEFRQQGVGPEDVDARVLSLLGAVPATALELIPEVGFVGRILGKGAGKALPAGASVRRKAGEFLKRGAVGGAVGAAAEGGTEAAQESLILGLTGQDLSDPENVTRLIESFAAGATVGGFVGAATNIFAPTRSLETNEPTSLLGGPAEPTAPQLGGPGPVPLLGGPGPVPLLGGPTTAVGPAVEQVDATIYTPGTEISGLLPAQGQQLMLPPPGAVLQVEGQPDFVVDENGYVRQATPDDVVVGISDRGFVPATAPGTQGVLDVFPGSQTTARELRGMMEPAAPVAGYLQPEGVTGEFPSEGPDLRQEEFDFNLYAPQETAALSLSGDPTLRAVLQNRLNLQRNAELAPQRQREFELAQRQVQSGIPPVLEPTAEQLRAAESRRRLAQIEDEVTDEEAADAWRKFGGRGFQKKYESLATEAKDQWKFGLELYYAEAIPREALADGRKRLSAVKKGQAVPIVFESVVTPTPVFKKETPRAAKKPKATALARGKQTRAASAAGAKPATGQAVAGARPAKTQEPRQEAAVTVQDVKADPQYKPTLAAIDKAVKDGVLTGKDRLKLLADLNKDGDFELVADIIKSKREAATKKAAPKSAPTVQVAPKAAPLKKGKPALTYEAVRKAITESADAEVISQDQYDLLIRAVDNKTTTPDRIKAQLAYLEKGGTIKKLAAGEARGLRTEEREVVREEGPVEVAEDLTAADTDYREMNVQANEALQEGAIKPLQFREIQNMIFQRRPLPAIKKAFQSYRDMIMERIGDVAGDGISVADAEAAIKRATGKWRTSTKTKVWENFEAVPADLRMQLSGPTVLGFYDTTTNTVHVIAGNHLSGAEAVATVYHEILGHRALRERFGKRALSILNAIYRTNKEVKDSADQYLKKTGKWAEDPNRYAYAVEEILAAASESGRRTTTLWQRLVNLVREFGRMIGFDIAYSNADVATILAMAHDSVIEGTGRIKGLMRAATDAPLMERQARIDELVDGLPSSLQNPVRTVTDTFGGAGVRTVARFGLMDQLLRLALSKGLKSVRRFTAASTARGRTLARHEQPFLKWAEDHTKLPANERGVGKGTVSGLIEKMTRTETWGFKPDYFAAEDQPAVAKLKMDPELEAWYDGLSYAGKAAVREAFRLNYQQLKDMQKAVMDNVASLYDVSIATAKDEETKKRYEKEKAASLDRYRTLLNMDPTRPYAPLRRNGNWVVVGRSQELVDAMSAEAKDYKLIRKLEDDPKHYYVDFADTRAEAAKIEREIRATYDTTQKFLKAQADENLYGGNDMMYAFQQLNTLVQDLKIGDEYTKQVRNAVAQLQIQIMAANSARKAEKTRRNIASGDVDMVRTTLSHGRSTAHFIASVGHNNEILESLRLVGQEARTLGPDREDKQAIYNGIVARYVDGMQDRSGDTLADRLTSFTSVWMLGLSPSYYIQQALQNLMLTMPWVAARYGYMKTFSTFRDAYAQVSKAWVDTGLTGQLDLNLIDEKYRPLAMFMSESGVLDVGLEREMGQITADSAGAISNAFARTANTIRALTRKVEAINRLSAAIAVYDLSRSDSRGAAVDFDEMAYRAYKKDFEQTYPDMSVLTPKQYAAALEALDVINTTHGDYSMENAPKFLRTPLGRTVLQFQKFRIMLAGTYIRAFYNAFRDPSLSAEEKRVARRALMFISGHAAIVGGLIGSPAAAIFVLIYNILSGDDEERGDLERDIREAVGDDTIANLLLRGVPTLFGVDVSGTLGQGNLLSVAPYADSPVDRESYAKYILSLTGPAIGGIGGNVADAIELVGYGSYYKALEKLVPRGIGAASRTMREQFAGETTRRGDLTTQPIDLGAVEAVWGTIGLAPIARVNRQYARDQFYKDERFYQDRAADIKRAYTEAAKESDAAAMNALRLEWQGLQDARRERGFKTQPMLDLIKAPREQAKREKQTVGGIPFTTGTEGRARQIAETAGTAR